MNRLGIDAFRARVEAEWRASRGPELAVGEAEIAALRAFFAPPDYERAAGDPAGLRERLLEAPQFAAWYRHNTRAHKVSGYRIVTVALKAEGVAPGDVNATQMDALAALAERYSGGEIRTTHEQNLVFADVRERDLFALWSALGSAGLATANAGTLNDLICCPGLDFCSLANAVTLPVAAAVQRRFSDMDRLYDIGEVQLKMSGCMNACAHHHVGHIGVLGVDKHGEQWYQLTLGGEAGDGAALGERLGAAVEQARVPDVIAAILETYVALRAPRERFIDTYRRVGIAPFREQVYGDQRARPADRRVLAACA